MVKHGLNAFLALSVTFANELATVCERVGADAAEVENADCGPIRASDPSAYVRAGPAFAGGTLARDVQFPARRSRSEHGLTLPVMDGIVAEQPRARPMGLPAAAAARLQPLVRANDRRAWACLQARHRARCAARRRSS